MDDYELAKTLYVSDPMGVLTMDDISELTQLEHLVIDDCQGMEDIEGIEELELLTTLQLMSLPQIFDIGDRKSVV